MTSQVNQDVEKTKARQISLFDHIFRDSEGNIVIAQMPNLPVSIGLTATLLQSILPGGKLQATLALIAYGTLFTWAWQELFDGVNYFRRSLGLLGLITLIALGLNLSGV